MSNVIGGDNAAYHKFKLGYNAGVFLNIPITEAVDFHPEFLYSTRGYKLAKTLNLVDSSITHRFSYFDFPLLFQVHAGDNGFIESGAQIGYISNDYQRGSVTNNTTITTIEESSVYGFKTTEYSLVLGGGMNLPYKLAVSARVVFGLTKLYDTENLERNLSIGLSLMYRFGAERGGRGGRGVGPVYKTI